LTHRAMIIFDELASSVIYIELSSVIKNKIR